MTRTQTLPMTVSPTPRARPYWLIAGLTLVAAPAMASLFNSFSGTLPAGFDQGAALDKRNAIWDSRILPTQYPIGRYPSDFSVACRSLLAMPGSLLTLNRTFGSAHGASSSTLSAEEMPPKVISLRGRPRTKFLHPIGTVAKIRFVPAENHPFTGLFAPVYRAPDVSPIDEIQHQANDEARSGVPGLVRLSLAVPLVPGAPFIPALALKLFVDRNPSANTVALHSFLGQGGDHNFFRHTLSTRVPAPNSLLLQPGLAWFGLFTPNARHVGTAEFVRLNRFGLAETKPVVPEFLEFEPNSTHREVDASGNQILWTGLAEWYDLQLSQLGPAVDFRRPLAIAPTGIALYNVYGTYQGQRYAVGEIRLETPFVASTYGDNILFFKHQHQDQD